MRKTATLVTLTVLASLLLLLACGRGPVSTAKYHCPMHPTYIADRPGDCPICGMRLVPIEEKAAPATVPAYVCPMHPEVVSDQPGQRCSKCGMRLVPSGDSSIGHAPAHKTYTCPMHPGFLTDNPDDRCPECGMKVKEVGGMSTPVPSGEPRPGGGGPVAASPGHRVLFYRNPMNPQVTSPVPAKDEMGMDYVPVYAEDVAPTLGGVPGLATVTVHDEPLHLAGVQTVPVVRETISRHVRTVGSVVADETRIRHVHTKISGWVEKLHVNYTGQLVKEGEPVMEIYSPELLASQEEYLKARESATRFASSELPEVRKGGEELLRAARRRLVLFDVPARFISTLDETGKAQRTVTLLAPVSGYVTGKGVFEGHEVEPGLELFEITDLSHVWVEADLYEFEAQGVRLGEEAAIVLPYEPARPLEGRVSFVYPTLNPETRTLKVRFDFANPGLLLKPGMFANVELSLASSEGLVVPDSAVMSTGERQVAFVRTSGEVFEPREVRVAFASEGNSLVLSGLNEGEQVVTRANFLLDSESRLRAVLAAATPPTAQGPGNRVPGTGVTKP
jgi:membrane fusion protein, copper/silver efflux system